jgi:LEA14-like dessication related protein
MQRTGHLLLLFLCLSGGGCHLFRRVVRSPKVTRVRPRIVSLDFRGVDLAFDVDLRSRSRIGMSADGASYALEIQRREFLTGETHEPFDLPAGATVTTTVPFRITYRELWRTYEELRDLGEASYALRGTLFFSPAGRRIGVPLSRSGTFPILRMPKFSNVRLELPKSPLGRRSLIVRADVFNPNVFEVDIRDFGYTFQLGGAKIARLTVTAAPPIGAGATGRLTLTGRVSPLGITMGLMSLENLKNPRLIPSGDLKTPHGKVKLPDFPRTRE